MDKPLVLHYDLSTPDCPYCAKMGLRDARHWDVRDVQSGQYWDKARQRPKTVILTCPMGHDWESLVARSLIGRAEQG